MRKSMIAARRSKLQLDEQLSNKKKKHRKATALKQLPFFFRLDQALRSSLRFVDRALPLDIGRGQAVRGIRRIRCHLARRVVDVLLELTNSLPHRAGDLWDPLRSEEKQDDHHDDDELGKTKIPNI